jgi:hypothetical protein
MDWTETGESDPTVTLPTLTVLVGLRKMMAGSSTRYLEVMMRIMSL